MDIEQNLRNTERLRKQRQNLFEENYQNRSGERLARSIESKFRTTFIGALSAFEDAFSSEWGNRLPEDQITDEEYEKRKVWEQVRTRILNNGNNQLRAALTELGEYTVEWNRHTITLRGDGRDGR